MLKRGTYSYSFCPEVIDTVGLRQIQQNWANLLLNIICNGSEYQVLRPRAVPSEDSTKLTMIQ